MKHCSVGIDLGTTYSAIAAFDSETSIATVLPDDYGRVLVPSVVSFDPVSNRVLVGSGAKHQLVLNPKNTIAHIKASLGRSRSEAPAMPQADDGSDVWFTDRDPLKLRFADQWMTPQEISALLLSELRRIAEANLGQPVRTAVIGIPAYYTSNQKQAVMEGALLSGLKSCRLVSEIYAASVAYNLDNSYSAPKTFGVLRVGGGTSDAAVVRFTAQQVEMLGVVGRMDLGGTVFDDRIVGWATQKIQIQYGVDVTSDETALNEMAYVAEKARLTLSFANSADMVLSRAVPGETIHLRISLGEFEELIRVDLAGVVSLLEEAIAIARPNSPTIDGVLLAGGASRTLAIKRQLEIRFPQFQSQIRQIGNLDSSVARGASVLARDLPDPPDIADSESDDSLSRARLRVKDLMTGRMTASRDRFGLLSTHRPSVFLCHASEDKPAVRELYSRLLEDGVVAWLDEQDLIPGQDWRAAISKAMRSVGVVLVCLSRASTGKTGYVQREIKEALAIADEQPEGSIFLIPARLEECSVPDRLTPLHRVDLFANGGYERLMRALRIRADAR